MFTAITLTAPQIAKMMATISGIRSPQPGMSLEDGVFIGKHSLFPYLHFITVNLACIIIRVHNEYKKCDDGLEAFTNILSRL